ncbi:MAG: tetratricopeptide repeat protein [Thermoplasmata archaeon]
MASGTKNLPLVGREGELHFLEEKWDEAKEGGGCTTLISGEPGIGKTRLLEEFIDRRAEEDVRILRGQTDSDSSQPFLLFSNMLEDYLSEKLFKEMEQTSFAEIFAVNIAGLLIATAQTQDEEELDGDIFAGMLSAVQNFVKDSFDQSGSQKGGLGRLEYGNMKILIEHAESIYVAAVVKGNEHPEMKDSLTKTVNSIQREYGSMLMDWMGDMEEVKGVQEEINELALKKFNVRRDLEGVELENERMKIADKVLGLFDEIRDDEPLLVVLEDLHWIDDSSLFVLNYLARNIVGKSIQIVASYRPGESVILDNNIQPIKDMENCYELDVEKLGGKAVDELVDAMFTPNNFSDEMVEKFEEQCQGNPFFVIEVLRQMEQEGNIVEREGKYVIENEDISAPSSIEEVVTRRLELLEANEIAIVEYAACEGSEVENDILEPYMIVADFNTTLERLKDFGILIPQEDTIKFSHAIFRDVIYENIPSWWKTSHHKSLGEYYEENYSGKIDEVLYDLARHFSCTNEYDKAFNYSFKAAEKAENTLAPEQAVKFYCNSLSVIPRVQSILDRREREIDLLNRIGDSYGLMGDFDDAVDKYKTALDKEEKDKKKAQLHRKIAYVYMNTGDYDESLEEADTAVDLLKNVEEETEGAKILRVKGRTYMRRGDYDSASEFLKDALGIAEDFEDEKEIAEIEHNLGTVEWYRGDYEDAIEHLERAREIRRDIGDERGLAKSLTNIGIVYYSKGAYKLALEYYGQGAEVFKKIGDKLNLASTYGNMGMVYYKKGELEKAVIHFERSLDLFQKVGDKSSIGSALNNLGLIYQDRGELDKSKEYHERSLGIRKEVGDKGGMATSFYNIGKNYISRNDYKEALNYLSRALDISQELGDRRLSNEILCDISTVYLEMNNIDKALESAKKALNLSLELKSKSLEGWSRRILASVYREFEDWESAIDEFDRSTTLLEKGGEKKELGDLYFDYGLLWRDVGKIQKAIDYMNKSLEIKEDLGLEGKVKITKQKIKELKKK